ncbi:MAG: hypothetical protein IPJ09_13055 [Saprospiraceae bacterium]|nr:hypothetical protein [Saprospiraceae bacterium]
MEPIQIQRTALAQTSLRGIDWNLYTWSPGASQFSLAHWGTTWQNDNEVIDYKKSNLTDYTEEQQILRLRITAPVTNVLCPYLKGEDLTHRIQISESNEWSYRIGGTQLLLYPGAYQLTRSDTTWYGWFGRADHAAMRDQITAKGGSLN